MRFVLLLFLSLAALPVWCQDSDPVLFTVENIDVPVSEFDYIYTKNNRENADYSRASVMEYLDLYTKFKLKVKKAREMKLDTIEALKTELAGYRSQLASSYLNDREVKQKLVLEAFERKQQDIRIRHILIRIAKNARPADTLAAHKKIQEAHDNLLTGKSFQSQVAAFSEDKNTVRSGGDLGYITAILPNGFYALENAAYSTAPGTFSKPFRTAIGYQIVLVEDRRPARGEIEAAHILLRVKKDGTDEGIKKKRIFDLHEQLKNGTPFEDLAMRHSEDEKSKRRGGFIGSFGINIYEPDFEDAVFGLANDGDYTEPLRTRIGWHIVQRISRKDLADFERQKRSIEAKINKDERIKIAERSMIRGIKEKAGFYENKDVLGAMAENLGENFLSYQWRPPVITEAELLGFANGMKATNMDFAKFLRSSTRARMRYPKGTAVSDAFKSLYDAFVDKKCLEYEESQLENKYPDFKALMREYEEGILLFEVTKLSVWDKAASDTAGLIDFHERHLNDYMWGERAEVTTYTFSEGTESKIIEKAKKKALKWGPEKMATKFNKSGELLSFSTQIIENTDDVTFNWSAGAISELKADENGAAGFKKVDRIIPAQPKSLNEARGYIIADYQDELEQQWIAELQKQYNIDLNEDVLNQIIR